MSFTLGDKTLGLWCVELPTGNWLAMLESTEDPNKFELTYRFRYYVDDKIHDSADRRNWYGGILTETTVDIAIKKVSVIYTALASAANTEQHWELLRDGMTTEQLMQRLGQMPGMHMRVEGPIH